MYMYICMYIYIYTYISSNATTNTSSNPSKIKTVLHRKRSAAFAADRMTNW